MDLLDEVVGVPKGETVICQGSSSSFGFLSRRTLLTSRVTPKIGFCRRRR